MLLIRYGKTAFTKGGIRGEFDFREEDADGVIREFASRGRDLVIDFEHQSLSGGKAPAAGWIGELYKNAEGLCAKVKYWTREAEKFLLNGEYRYFSYNNKKGFRRAIQVVLTQSDSTRGFHKTIGKQCAERLFLRRR